ncbi:MAG: secretion protein [Myxococcales bacterium]|nr:secretion protein [Myxococcales bacterium]
MRLFHLALWIILLVGPIGCGQELSTDLTEAEANEIIVLLDAQGIAASKERAAGPGEGDRFAVEVPNGDVARALSAMAAADLPRQDHVGFAGLFDESSLVPTATEERARLTAALSGELSQSLQALDGVSVARVHIALPEPGPRFPGEDPGRARASVLIKQGPGNGPPEDAIRRLVSGAVDGLRPEDVAVVITPGARPSKAHGNLVRLGPIGITRGSATLFKVLLGAMLTLNILLAGVVVTLWRRR